MDVDVSIGHILEKTQVILVHIGDVLGMLLQWIVLYANSHSVFNLKLLIFKILYLVVMVTGGTGATTSAELLHINGTKLCSLPNLPVARYQHSQTGIVFDNFAIYSATFFC